MSVVASNAFPLTFPTEKHDHSINPNPNAPPSAAWLSFAFPSPPPSIGNTSDLDTNTLDFDLDAFTHCSPDNSNFLDNTFGSFDSELFGSQRGSIDYTSSAEVSPIASIATPTSTAVVSPKSSFSLPIASDVIPSNNNNSSSDVEAAEALSNHHLQRYLHYKALAAQAEADARVAALPSFTFPFANGVDTFDVDSFLLANPMPDVPKIVDNNNNNNSMLSFQSQPQAFYGIGQQPEYGSFVGGYQPPHVAASMHAQAQAHLQAHDAANRVAAQRIVSPTNNGLYMQPSATRTTFEVPQVHQVSTQLWSRTSTSTLSGSIPSPPNPATPIYPVTAIPTVEVPEVINPVPTFAIVSQPMPAAPSSLAPSEGENELDMDDIEEDSSLSEQGDSPNNSQPSINGIPLTNLHGGGRGYVPGKTPDDPKKRHKCQVCGRGFARAFNLKSHIQTHNPLRSKPHECPHSSCKRGFSRLHDLERHRQGIHGDGPLMDAKKSGVTPSVARAQGRILKRAESGGLI